MHPLVSRLRPYAPAAAIALVAIAIAWGFAATTLMHTRPMGLPLDDSYIYLTYAKQFGRGQPFTYYPGGGYSAGSTSVLWPMVLAPFWTFGARGHALVWVSFLVCTALYAAVAVGTYRFVRGVSGEVAGVLAAALVLASAPFAWCALSGMEVAFAAALLVGVLLLLAAHEGPRPRKLLVAALAASALARPEALLIVGGLCGVAVLRRLLAKDLRSAVWWALPVVPAGVWLLANRVIAGNFFPNTGVAKSHFYLPGFDWTYWWGAVKTLTWKMLTGLYKKHDSPLVWPRLVLLAQVAGSVRVVLWARRERKLMAGVVAVAAPWVLLMAVIISSGQWTFQNYRYIAPALPLVALLAGCGLAPPRWWPAPIEFFAPVLRRVWLAAMAVLVGLYAHAAWPRLKADMKLYAQGAMDTNTQVVRIGHYLHDRLPEARVMFHDAGAIAYYGDTWVYDMLGLVTNHQTEVANHGPGSRFEFLESLPPDARPTHFAYYPAWIGTNDWYGDVLLHTPLRRGFEPRRMVGDADMELIVANWDHAHSAERPLEAHPGWQMVDRIDVADLGNEHAHDWAGALGRRKFGEPTAKWSVVERELLPGGLAIDGGRTIRGGSEAFTVSLDPARDTLVVLRTGGQAVYGWNEPITKPVTLDLLAGDRVLGSVTIAPPDGKFAELSFTIPAGTFSGSSVELHTRATGSYRVFHWFVLQNGV